MSNPGPQSDSRDLSRRDALKSMAFAASALPAIAAAFLASCSKEPSPEPAPKLDRDTELAKGSLEAARLLLLAGLRNLNDPLEATVRSVPLELDSSRHEIGTGQLSGSHWDPARGVIGTPPENALNFSVMGLAVILGHEFFHASRDTVPASKLPLAQYYSAEIRAHIDEVSRIIPALETMLQQRGLDPKLDGMLLRSLKAEAEFKIEMYKVRRDIYLPFQAETMREIQSYVASAAHVDRPTYDALVGVNSAWNKTQERRFRGQSESASELSEFVAALKGAGAIPVLQAPLAKPLAQLAEWQASAGRLAALASASEALSAEYKTARDAAVSRP